MRDDEDVDVLEGLRGQLPVGVRVDPGAALAQQGGGAGEAGVPRVGRVHLRGTVGIERPRAGVHLVDEDTGEGGHDSLRGRNGKFIRSSVSKQDEFRQFERRHGGTTSGVQAKSPSGSSSGKRAQPPVTSERLATTEELDPGPSKPADSKPASRKEALTTYKDALAAYRGGEYASALGGFEAFLASGPQADYVDNALYWIGECHFGLGKFDAAVSYFQRVMAEQPDGNKVPDAMLKMSLAYDRTGRAEQASKLLEDLTRQFPATNAGRLASQKLAERR